MSCYRVIQLTNTNIGAVTVNNLLPLGLITRRIFDKSGCCPTFTTNTTSTNVLTINECGNYNISYSLSGIASAAGIVTATILVNNTATYTVSTTVVAGATFNLTLPYQIRVLPNCASNPTNNPVNISIQLGGVGITGGTSNLLVERVY